MSFYKLPINYNTIKPEELTLFFYKNGFTPFISNNLFKYLNETKEQIDNNKDWSNFKKYTNPYEFIHTPYGNKLFVSKLKPLSRAYYKLLEIIHEFDLIDSNEQLKSFHLAEGPGGFIECMKDYRHNSKDQYYGMTLINQDNSSIPGWGKILQFLEENKNIILEKGKSGDGDLYNHTNLKYIIENYEGKFDFVTGDGGFDFSINYNLQEIYSLRLLFTQFIYCIFLLKKNGHFVLKIFDIFFQGSVDILYLCSYFFKEVYICKPRSSRYANSEKYLVCKYFKFSNMDQFKHRCVEILRLLENKNVDSIQIERFLKVKIPKIFMDKIEEINILLGQQQIENINQTISLISNYKYKKDRLENIKKKHVDMCIEWCKKYNIPYYQQKKNNMFLNG